MGTKPGETYIIRDCAASYNKFFDSEAIIFDNILQGNSYNFSPPNKLILAEKFGQNFEKCFGNPYLVLQTKRHDVRFHNQKGDYISPNQAIFMTKDCF